MPEDGVPLQADDRMLTSDEIVRLAELFVVSVETRLRVLCIVVSTIPAIAAPSPHLPLVLFLALGSVSDFASFGLWAHTQACTRTLPRLRSARRRLSRDGAPCRARE